MRIIVRVLANSGLTLQSLTGVSLRTVRRRIADESIPSTKLGGTRLVEKAGLDRLFFPSAVALG